jgi:hypothetical protein
MPQQQDKQKAGSQSASPQPSGQAQQGRHIDSSHPDSAREKTGPKHPERGRQSQPGGGHESDIEREEGAPGEIKKDRWPG